VCGGGERWEDACVGGAGARVGEGHRFALIQAFNERISCLCCLCRPLSSIPRNTSSLGMRG
jgi:hypothetical protein